jgi:hypothetical protein
MPFSALAFDSYPWLAAMISPVRGLEVEPELPGVVLAYLELGRHGLLPRARVYRESREQRRRVGDDTLRPKLLAGTGKDPLGEHVDIGMAV